jgi:hypothetical protein
MRSFRADPTKKKTKKMKTNVENPVEELEDEEREDIEIVEDHRHSGSDEVEDQEVKFKGVIDAVDLSDGETDNHRDIEEKSVALNASYGDFNFHPTNN